MRQLRRQEGKRNEGVQGFYSNGILYVFVSIGPDGRIFESKTYNCRYENDFKTAFNWIVDLLISAAKTSPNTSPTKPEKDQKQELAEFEDKVFLRPYHPGVDDDDDPVVSVNDPNIEIVEWIAYGEVLGLNLCDGGVPAKESAREYDVRGRGEDRRVLGFAAEDTRWGDKMLDGKETEQETEQTSEAPVPRARNRTMQ